MRNPPPSAFDGSASPSEIRRIGRFAVEFGGMLGMVKVKIWASGGGDVLEVQFDKTANGEGIQQVLAQRILGAASKSG